MREIIIKTKKKIFGTLNARELSKIKGNGLNFKEIREYIYGEDAKRIDWKISAKFNKPYVKEFEEEKELNIIITILASGSLHFGIKKLKTELIAEIVALLGYASVKYDNKVRLLIFEKEPVFYSKPIKNKKLIPFLVQKSLEFDYLKKDYSLNVIDFLNTQKKSILFLIGDFYKHPQIHKLKHETYVIWIRDFFEENPKELGEIDLIDPVKLTPVHTILNKKNITQLSNKIAKEDKKFKEYLFSHKINFCKIYTQDDPFLKLMELLK